MSDKRNPSPRSALAGRPCRRLPWGLATVAALLGLVGAASRSHATITFTPSGFIEETIASGLPFATGIAFAPDGRMFIALKAGVVRVYQNGALLPTPFIDISAQVADSNDRGLLGITLHPDFPNTPYVYLLFTWNPPGYSNTALGARVSRLIRVEADAAQGYNVATAGSTAPQTTPGGPGHVILAGTNSTAANIGNPTDGRDKTKASCMTGLTMAGAPIEDCIPSDEDSHSIGTVLFGLDGSLYFGSGDGANYTEVDHRALRSLNLNSMAGKIMRIDPVTRLGLPDNPFFDPSCPQCNRSKVYSMGLRNPFRFTIHPVTNEPYIGDVGWSGWEEINTGKGVNFGWPCYEGGTAGNPAPVEGGVTTSLQMGAYGFSASTSAVCQALYAQGLGAVRAPVFAYSHDGTDGAGTTGGASANGGAFYTGTVYPPQFQNAEFILDYNRRWIRYLTFDAQGQATVHNFGRETANGMVQVLQGPDTNLYVVVLSVTGSQVRRIRYVGGGNTPPTAVATATPTIGTAPLTVAFSSLGSYDPDAQPLSYGWTFGDGGSSTEQHPTHTYAASGVYTATLTLTELTAPFATRTADVVVTVGNDPPLATITAPPDGTTYQIGDIITYSGTGSAGGEPLPPSQLSWEVRLHHNQHLHFQTLPGGSGGTFEIIEHGDDTFHELCLTASVSADLTDTQCVDLLPEKTAITLTTDPPGLFINYEDEGLTQASPMIINPVVGSDQTASVQAIQGGLTFTGWADGEPSTSHPFLVGTTAVTYTALYVNQPPVAVAAANPVSGAAPLTVAFTGSGSSDPEFGTLTHSWDFGDGGTSTAADPTHVYAAEGTYEAVLTVTDQRNGSAAQAVTVTVTPPSPQCGNGQLDDGEACDGGACCTAGCQFAGAGTECRAAAGACDVAETCTGTAATCPANGFAANGTACGDGNVCNGAETCQSGACTAGTALTCNDGNVCTTDTCNPASGCVFSNNTGPCSDGIACTSDVCGGGTCTSTPACAAGESCNLSTGQCEALPGVYTIWPDTQVPSGPVAGADLPVELGVKFRSDVAGYVAGIRFYKSAGNTGPHVGNLWSSAGTRLATATFSGESAAGWQEVTFSSPVAIAANTVYVASYFAPSGFYNIALNYFATQGVDNPPLHALADGVSGGNGVYAYNATSAFPTETFSASNYWVDVVFTTTPPGPGALTITTAGLPAAAQGTAYSAGLEATGGMPPYTWAIASGTLPDGLALNASTGVISGTPTTAGTSNFTIQVSGGGTATRALSIAVASPVASIWPGTTVPSGAVAGADLPVELGVKFRSTVAGYITGIRFYKNPGNTGTHVGNLWSSAGTQLATATFTGESAEGWQEVTFATPVAIAANTTYVASYHCPNGFYNIALNYFATQGVDNPPLHLLANGESPNGVFVYNATSVFPNQTYAASNYWVDVVFAASSPTGAPTITTSALPAGTVGTAYTATLAASGGTPPYTWAIVSGTLPGGLALNASTGVISGTPTTAGTSSFTVQVTAGQTATRALGITIGSGQGPNSIAAENALPGNPSSEWDVSGAGDPSIQGFATDISVDQGETVGFKVDTDSTNYRLDIYRLGYYGGLGARLVATVQPSVALPQSQPACLSDPTTGLVDCGNWALSASWSVPPTATSGIYIAKLVREDPEDGRASHVVFVVRDDDGGSDLLFQTSDTTWQAYNTYGGNSLYFGSPAGRAYKVSYNRPFTTRCCSFPQGSVESWLFDAEYPMVRWLERNGYDVSYTTGVDADRRGGELLEHRVYMPVGHDEYWSGGQRAAVEAARAAGVHVAILSGNHGFWKTRWESSIDGSGTPHRTLVCYKETHANAKIDPLPGVWTGTWRDPRFGPHDGGRPENALNGSIFTVNGIRYDAMQIPAADGKMRFWRNTSVASLPAGQVAVLPTGILGPEWDEDLDNGWRPAGLVRLSTTTVPNVQLLQDFGTNYATGTATHHLTLYRHASGALVFAAGTINWPWGLDDQHDVPGTPVDARIQQATVNLFADMGVQPATLQAGLAAASASTDTTAPSAAITSPANGATVSPGASVTIAGTASDVGGQVGGVEVSTDGGTTWHPANGRASWTYAWVPSGSGSATLRARAADDSGNLGAASPAVTVTVAGATLTSIAVTPVNPTVTVGGAQQFTATGTYSDASTQDLTGQVTWASSNTGVATVNATGLATAVSAGTTTISATLGAVSGNTTLTVQPGPLTVTTTALPAGTVGVAYSATLAASGGTPPYTWAIVSGQLPAGLVLNASTGGISGTPTATGTANFTVQVTAGGQTATKPLGITVNTATQSIWPSNPVPAVVDAGPDSPVELGVKFRSDVPGFITGIRFYKSTANTGTHVGNLWSSSGTLLATGTFTGETASGWQQLTFVSPVAIAANTVYVASYFCPNGHYSGNVNYFATQGVDTPPLHALASGEAGGNGVFSYGATSSFPTASYSALNYWVDVVFAP